MEEDKRFGDRYQQIAAELFAKYHFGESAEVAACGDYAHLDYVVHQGGKLLAGLEVKARRITSDKYDSTIVNFEKHRAGKFFQRFLGVRTIALVVYTDKAGYFYLDERPDGKQFIGRQDRNGRGTEHALYKRDRIVWVDGLLDKIVARQSAA